MLRRKLTLAALLISILSTGAATQDTASILAAAAKAMGADTLNAITYAGIARNGQLAQRQTTGEPLAPLNITRITEHTRTINFAPPSAPAALLSRATGPTQLPAIPGAPPQPARVFNQNVTGTQAAYSWAQALNIW